MRAVPSPGAARARPAVPRSRAGPGADRAGGIAFAQACSTVAPACNRAATSVSTAPTSTSGPGRNLRITAAPRVTRLRAGPLVALTPSARPGPRGRSDQASVAAISKTGTVHTREALPISTSVQGGRQRRPARPGDAGAGVAGSQRHRRRHRPGLVQAQDRDLVEVTAPVLAP